jgi:hypothetical protein
MSKESINCKNCESSLESTFEFCPNCGQKTKEELTVGVLFYNTISNYFAVDARFFKSFIPLMTKPGYLANKFIQGKRLLYLHPAQLYLFISIIFFFLYSFKQKEQINAISAGVNVDEKVRKATDSIVSEIERDSIAKAVFLEQMKENQTALGIKDEDMKVLDSIVKTQKPKENLNFNFGFDEEKVDSLLAIKASKDQVYMAMGMEKDDGTLVRKFYAQMLKIYKNKGGIGNILKAFYDTVPISMFFLLPIFAFILKMLFYRRGRFAHHLVFTFYFFAYLFTVFSILIFISLLWDVIPVWLDVLIVLSTFFYLFLAIKRFYGQGWFVSLFKSWVATVAFMVFVLPIAGGFMLVFAFMFY